VGYNKEYTIKIVKKPCTAGTGKENGGVIFVLQTSNRTKCMCTNAVKCGKEKGNYHVETCINNH
jgi:hypothetical protein